MPLVIWRVVLRPFFFNQAFLYFLWRFCIKVANWERDTNLATEQYCAAAEIFFVEILGQSDAVTVLWLYLCMLEFVFPDESYSLSLYLRQCLVQVGACVANPELNYGEIMLNLPRRPPPPACLHYTQCTNQPRVNVHSLTFKCLGDETLLFLSGKQIHGLSSRNVDLSHRECWLNCVGYQIAE